MMGLLNRKDGYEKPPKWVYDHAKVDGPTIYDKKEKPDVKYSNGKKSDFKITPEHKKAIIGAAIGVATVAAAAYAIKKNPEAINKIMSKVKNVKLKDVRDTVINKGKECVNVAINGAKNRIREAPKKASNAIKTSMNGLKEGIKEGLHEAPRKASKVVTMGAGLYLTKKILDASIGKEDSAIIFQANDPKKIGKFWKTSLEDKDKDDDD